MMQSGHIIDVTEGNFEYEVIAYSQKSPVIVDFWATWCAPCRVLGPLLEKLTLEAQGNFRLAKVDVDQNQNLAQRYNVRSIPTVKVFKDGNMVSEFTGALPEPRLREFIQSIIPSQDSLQLEKGRSLLTARQGRNAEVVYRQILEKNRTQPAAILGLIKSLLLQGQGSEALALISNFPASRELIAAEILRPLAQVFSTPDSLNTYSDDPLEAAYFNALRLARRGNLEAGMDGLLDLLRQEKTYKNGEVRKVFLSLLELSGDDNPSTRQYRNELASVLF
jgi:putative thioredoxin